MTVLLRRSLLAGGLLLVATPAALVAQRLQIMSAGGRTPSYTVATYDFTASTSWSGGYVMGKLQCRLVSVDAVVIDGTRHDVAAMPGELAQQVRAVFPDGCSAVRPGWEFVESGRVLHSIPPGSGGSATWEQLYGRDVRKDVNNSSVDGVAKVRSGALVARLHDVELYRDASVTTRQWLVAERVAERKRAEAAAAAAAPKPAPAAPGAELTITAGSTPRATGAAQRPASTAASSDAPVAQARPQTEAERRLALREEQERRLQQREDSIAAYYAAERDSAAARAERQALREQQAEELAEAGVETVMAFAALFQKSESEKAREAAAQRAARAEAQRAYTAARLARLEAIGDRPQCTRGDVSGSFRIGETKSGALTGHECRRPDNTSAVLYTLRVPKQGQVGMRLRATGTGAYFYIEDAAGGSPGRVDARGDIVLEAGEYLVTVATALPGEAGTYEMTVDRGTRSRMGRFVMSIGGSADSYGSESAALDGLSATGGTLRLGLGAGDHLLLFGHLSQHGEGTEYAMDYYGGGARVYALGSRSAWRPFVEAAMGSVSAGHEWGTRAGEFDLYEGTGVMYGVGLERFFDRMFGVEVGYSRMSADLEDDGATVGTTTGRLHAGMTLHF